MDLPAFSSSPTPPLCFHSVSSLSRRMPPAPARLLGAASEAMTARVESAYLSSRVLLKWGSVEMEFTAGIKNAVPPLRNSLRLLKNLFFAYVKYSSGCLPTSE